MKKALSILLTTATILSAAISVSAITMSDTPITGGATYWGQEEMMYTGEPAAASNWSNAFCNEDWTGALWEEEWVGDVPCVKVVGVEGSSTCFMDFNYYQWNNDKYYPSLDGSEYSFIKIRYMLNDAGAKDLGTGKFWASEDAQELSTTEDAAQITFDMPSAKANEWQEVIVDLSSMQFGDKAWADTTIRQFRVYPFGDTVPSADAVCYIEYIALFATEAEAKAFTGYEEVKVEETVAETAAAADVETVAAPVTAPATLDAGIVAAVAAIVSAAGYTLTKKH